MGSKKRKIKGKISSTEVRTPINLKEITNKQKVILRQPKNHTIPLIKQKEAAPFTQKSFTKASQGAPKSFHPLMENPLFSEDISQKSYKFPLKIQVESDSFSHDEVENEERELDMKSVLSGKENSWKTNGEKLIKFKFKQKYKEKMNEKISRQNEIHKLEIESIKRDYEAKVLEYKEAIKKLQEDYEEACNAKEIDKKTGFLDPLIEENFWLKSQITALRYRCEY